MKSGAVRRAGLSEMPFLAARFPHLVSPVFRRLRRLFEKRRYRDAAYLRPNLASRTEASWFERVVRSLRRREIFGYDDREARAGDNIRRVVFGLFMIFVIWFAVRSLLAINIFAG